MTLFLVSCFPYPMHCGMGLKSNDNSFHRDEAGSGTYR